MTRISSIAAVVLFAASVSVLQTVAQISPQSATPNAVGHGAFPVQLTKTLDSSKLKEGDTVEVDTAGSFKLPDGTLVPKGSKLTGHVVAAKATAKGDPQSQLTLAFDKLNVANGKQLSIKGSVQAVYPAPDEVDPGMPVTSSHQGGGGMTPTPPAPEYKPTTDIKTGSAQSSHAQGTVDPKAVGVQGIDNLQLEEGILSSHGKRVKLNNGVRMIVRADILG